MLKEAFDTYPQTYPAQGLYYLSVIFGYTQALTCGWVEEEITEVWLNLGTKKICQSLEKLCGHLDKVTHKNY